MTRARTAILTILTALSAIAALFAAPSPAHADIPPTMLGPGDAHVNGIGKEAVIRMSKYGYVYIAGKHNSHLTIKYVEEKNALRYRDTRTLRVNSMPKRCSREKVKTGISVLCKIPAKFDGRKMFVQVWPRLGDDFIDGRTLPKRFRLWALVDAGNDVVYGGAGDDFVNGAKGNDRIYGGPGNDWLRGGPGRNRIVGGPGKDRIAWH